MIALNLNINSTGDFEKGISRIAKVRGFEISERGKKVNISEGGESVVAERGGEYYIEFSRPSELFRALSMLVGLIQEGRKGFVIREKTKTDMCGTMIDCSRGAVMKPLSVIDFMTRMAMMGMDTIMLYTEDIYCLDDYKYFGYLRGRYSDDEIKEICLAAEELKIEVIPCIQTLGHLMKTLRWGYANDMKDDPDVLLIDEEKTYVFIEAMIKKWRTLCKTDKIHIGMDEAEGVGLGEYFNRHGYCDRYEIMLRHVQRVNDIAAKYGFKPMMWSDMFFKIGSKKRDYYDLNAEILPSLSKKIPTDASLVYWDYYHHDIELYRTMLKKHKEFGRNIIFAGGAWLWRGLCPHYDKTFDTTLKALSACDDEQIKSVIATMWGDDGGEVSRYTMLLGLQLFADYSHCDKLNIENTKENFKLCTGYDADAFIALDFDNIPAKKKDALATSKQVFYQDVLLGLFDKNFAEYDLEGYYDGIIDKLGALSNQGDMEYLFEYYRCLAEILKKKCHIGVKIRRAYNANDIDELLKCADVLSELSDDYKEFYKKLCSVWNRENKPFGFEVFEERIGGMLMRFKSCGEKIIKYCRAETERIDELDEEILWYGDENSKGELLSEHFYNNMRVF